LSYKGEIAKYTLLVTRGDWKSVVALVLGKSVDSKNVKKYKNDVFRLLSVVLPENRISVSEKIKKDIKKFLELVESEPVAVKDIGITVIDFQQALSLIDEIYLQK
jgi:hypothetical protein